MDEPLPLTTLSEVERQRALERFRLLQPFLAGQATLRAVARAHGLALRTAHRWVAQYRYAGLAGLARKPRTDQVQRRALPDLQRLVEGLALQKTKPSAAAIHRQVAELARQAGWVVPSYSWVYDIVRHLDPAL